MRKTIFLLLITICYNFTGIAQNSISKSKKIIEKQFKKLSKFEKENLIPYVKATKYGYMHPDKSIAIKPIFNDATFFNHFSKIAKVKINENYFRVHSNGLIETTEEYYKRIDEEDSIKKGVNNPYVITHSEISEISVFYPAKKCFETDSKGRLKYTMPLYSYNDEYVIKYNNTEYASLYKLILPEDLTKDEIKKIKILGTRYAKKYPKLIGLVDENEKTLKNFEFKFKQLRKNKAKNNDTYWFYYKDKDDNNGFININGEKKLTNEFETYPFSSQNKLNLSIVKTSDNKYGVIDLDTYDWYINPSEKQIKFIEIVENKENINDAQLRDNYTIYFKIIEENSFYYFNKEKGSFK